MKRTGSEALTMSDNPTELLPGYPEHRDTAGPPKDTTMRNVVIGLAIALFVILIGVILWLLFIRGNPGPAPTPTATESSATPTPSPTPTETVSPPPLDPQSCTTDNSSVALGDPDGAAGSTVVPLIFTNTGSEPCTLEGYPVVEFVGGGDGTQIGQGSTQDTQTSPVELITIEPGETASSLLKITSAGNVCEPVDVDGLRVIPPGSNDAFFIAETSYQACEGNVSLLTVTAVVKN
jgi:hypothetical protein